MNTFSFTTSSKKYNLETVTGNLIILRNDNIKSDGRSFEFSDSDAQFHIDAGTDSQANNFLNRFRPVSQPTKYLAVSGNKIVLKDIPANATTISDSTHDFIVDASANSDYLTYLYRYSPVNQQLYMSTDSNNDVILAAKSSKAWLKSTEVAPVATTATTLLTISPDSLPELDEVLKDVTKEICSETNGSIVIEEESFHVEKMILSNKASIGPEE